MALCVAVLARFGCGDIDHLQTDENRRIRHRRRRSVVREPRGPVIPRPFESRAFPSSRPFHESLFARASARRSGRTDLAWSDARRVFVRPCPVSRASTHLARSTFDDNEPVLAHLSGLLRDGLGRTRVGRLEGRVVVVRHRGCGLLRSAEWTRTTCRWKSTLVGDLTGGRHPLSPSLTKPRGGARNGYRCGPHPSQGGRRRKGRCSPPPTRFRGRGKGTHRIHTSGRARHQAARGREMDEMEETSRNFTEDTPT
eukprot:scaffold1758_cov333-Pavlova_lutheri.AAC.23